MQKYDVHFCLVSAQAAANLFPISDTRFKPKQVVLFVSNDMQQKAEQLERLFKLSKIETKFYSISKPFDFEKCEEEIHSALLDYVGNKDISSLSIALNLTGGTKPMSLAAFSVFNAYDKSKDIFYVDTANQRFSFLTNKSNSFTMQLELKVKNYLKAYGYEVLGAEKHFEPKVNELFFDFFVTDYHKNKHLIARLNYYTKEANKKDIFYFKDDDFDVSLYNFLYDLEQLNLVKLDEKYIDFKGNGKFVGGAWLEHITFQTVKKLENIDDVEMSLEYANSAFDKNQKVNSKENSGLNNELDVSFIYKNKLHIIECKTKRMDKDGEEDETQDIIHKLKSLRDNVGIMTKGCLIVCGKDAVPPAVRNRAKSENIKIIEGSEIQALDKHLQEWMNEE